MIPENASAAVDWNSGIITEMAERGQTYAERIPPLVHKREEDSSHLSDAMADILYPGSRPRPVRMGVVFRNTERFGQAVADFRAIDVCQGIGCQYSAILKETEKGTESR